MIDRRRRTVDAAARARELANRARILGRDVKEAGTPLRPARPPRADVKAQASSHTAAVSIDAIAAGGDGVGRIDGMAVFVPRTAPGDVVEAQVVTHRRFARGRVMRVITPSPLREEPQCHHYTVDDCGGCQLQHLNAAAQLNAKSQIVRDTLSRIGKRDVELPEVEASPRLWDYRQKLTLTLTRPTINHDWTGGLHRLGESDEIFALTECRISMPALVATWHDVQAASRFLPDGLQLRVTFRQADNSERVALTVYGGTEWHDATEFAKKLPSLAALWWISETGERVEVVAPDSSAESTAANFVQANASLAPALHDYVLTQTRSFKPASVVDAYAGTGALSLQLAHDGVAVTAIEWDASAVALMREKLPATSTVLESSVEGVIDRALYQPSVPHVVVLNPPRVGLHATVTSALEAQSNTGVRAIVYISCDPATLARDLTRLPNWRIQSLRCFDMFPQTAHVETVCVLIPERS